MSLKMPLSLPLSRDVKSQEMVYLSQLQTSIDHTSSYNDEKQKTAFTRHHCPIFNKLINAKS